MYTGIELKWKTGELIINETKRNEYIQKGKEIKEGFTKEINTKLDAFLMPNGKFSATDMRDNWFPQINVDVFISHSHLDHEKALLIAGYLEIEFGILAFIDSTVWGYSNDLLKIIDNQLCMNEDGKTYIYEKRNYTTSIVHLILSSAINEMIFRTELLLFLNTHKSIPTSTKEFVKKTESGWIYSELKMSSLVAKNTPEWHRNGRKKVMFSKANESFEFDLDTSELHSVEWSDFKKWQSNKLDTSHPLDQLYGIITSKNFI